MILGNVRTCRNLPEIPYFEMIEKKWSFRVMWKTAIVFISNTQLLIEFVIMSETALQKNEFFSLYTNITWIKLRYL